MSEALNFIVKMVLKVFIGIGTIFMLHCEMGKINILKSLYFFQFTQYKSNTND